MKNPDRDEKHSRRRESDRTDDPDGIDVAEALYGTRPSDSSESGDLFDEPTERELLQECVEWVRARREAVPELESLFRPAAGEEGTPDAEPGLPTMCLPLVRTIDVDGAPQKVGALWVEIKTAGAQLSEKEQAWRRRLIRHGHAWTLCRSVEEFQAAVTDYVAGDFFLDV